jgi:hypothetical protein
MAGIPLRFLPSRTLLAIELDVAPVVNEIKNADDVVVSREYGPQTIKQFDFPMFKRGDWVRWRKAIDDDRTKAATEGLTAAERSRLLMAHPIRGMTNPEMRALLDTDAGTGYVFRVCAKRAGVPPHVITRMVDEGDVEELDMESVALMLAGIYNPHDVARQLAKRRGELPPDDNDAANNPDAADDGDADADAGTDRPNGSDDAPKAGADPLPVSAG